MAGHSGVPARHVPVKSNLPTQHNKPYCLHRAPIIPVSPLVFKGGDRTGRGLVCCALIFRAVLSKAILNTAFCVSGRPPRGRAFARPAGFAGSLLQTEEERKDV